MRKEAGIQCFINQGVWLSKCWLEPVTMIVAAFVHYLGGLLGWKTSRLFIFVAICVCGVSVGKEEKVTGQAKLWERDKSTL